eukprot:3028589-Amphidinium_carterae.1
MARLLPPLEKALTGKDGTEQCSKTQRRVWRCTLKKPSMAGDTVEIACVRTVPLATSRLRKSASESSSPPKWEASTATSKCSF